MGAKQVVVQGGGDNLYKVSESSRTFYVYRIDVGIFSNTHYEIGQTRNFEDALSLIKSHSGKGIKKISPW